MMFAPLTQIANANRRPLRLIHSNGAPQTRPRKMAQAKVSRPAPLVHLSKNTSGEARQSRDGGSAPIPPRKERDA